MAPDSENTETETEEKAEDRSIELSWPMEAERVSMDDPLLECLAIMAGEAGRRTTAAALAAGLPMPKQGLASPAVFVRAAERVDMNARMVRRPLKYLINSANLPCILVLKGYQACILVGRSSKDTADVIFPETPDQTVQIDLHKLNSQYGGYSFFVRARARMDSRAGPREVEETRSWFWSAIWRYRRVYYEVMLAAVMINMFALASSLFTMNVYDRVLPNNAFETLWVLGIGVMIVYLFDFILKNLRAHFLDMAGRKADNIVSARIFEHILAMKMTARPSSVGVLAANMREFETLRDFFTSATIVALIDMPFILLFVGIIYLIGGPVAYVPGVLVPLTILVGWVLQKPLDKAIAESMREGGYKSGILYETLTGLETIKAQAAEGFKQREWEEVVEKVSYTNVKARSISAFGVNFAALAANLSTTGIIIAGAYLISEGELSMGGLIACVILSGRAMAPLAQVAALLTKLSQSREALERLDDLMQSPVERPAGESFVSSPVLSGAITFRDVTFKYPNQQRKALDNVSFAIEAGQRVGIIGPVGSGKTTIERLVLNMYQPESGSVLLDGTNVQQIDPADLRRNIGVVQQTPYLFFGTVRDNITLGHETVPDSAVIRAAQLAGVMDFLGDTESGLNTQVGERGEWLSGGQRQAIAVARALLYDPPILLLDEPTASIDPGSEHRLAAHLAQVCKEKTVVLITHKSAVLSLVDHLILMDSGKIVGMGPRDEVIKGLQTGKFKSAKGKSPGMKGKKKESEAAPDGGDGGDDVKKEQGE